MTAWQLAQFSLEITAAEFRLTGHTWCKNIIDNKTDLCG